MDGVLRVPTIPSHCDRWEVSILVLMDGVLRDKENPRRKRRKKVSILVLMDGVLRVGFSGGSQSSGRGFNPCSNGWCTSSK